MGFKHHASIGFAGVYVLKAVIQEIFYNLVIYFIHPHDPRCMANSIEISLDSAAVKRPYQSWIRPT